MNKSIGLLKSIMKKTYINKRQTMEVNHSNRYSPSKRQKRQIISINKASKEDFNSNIEKKKIIYQQSIQKLDRNNKLKLSQNKKNMEINRYYKNNNILNGNNNIPNNFKNRLNNSKTINHHLKNKNYNTSLQKKIGSKSYVDLFQNNNIYNSNDHIMHGGGKTISNSIYEKIYDFENENFNFSNKANNNNENNSSNEYNNNNTLAEEANNIINVLLNYIDIIKKEYEKIILEKMQNKEKEIIKLKRENEFLIKENKNLKFKILQIFYCAKKINSNKNNEESKSTYSIKQLLKENLFLRKCLIKSDNINEDYLVQLEKDIIQQFKYKELLNQKKILEEEKNNEENNTKLNNNKEENSINNSNNNNPFKFINENNNNNNSNNNKINHKRQKTQYKLNFYSQNKKNNIDNNIDDEEFDKNENNEEDSLSNYLNEMNNNILMGKTKEGSQKNLIYINKNNKSINNANNINKDNNSTLSENINNNKSNNEQSFDSIVHNVNNNTDNKKENELIKENENDNNNINKKLFGMSSNSTFDKYSQRIEFTK